MPRGRDVPPDAKELVPAPVDVHAPKIARRRAVVADRVGPAEPGDVPRVEQAQRQVCLLTLVVDLLTEAAEREEDDAPDRVCAATKRRRHVDAVGARSALLLLGPTREVDERDGDDARSEGRRSPESWPEPPRPTRRPRRRRSTRSPVRSRSERHGCAGRRDPRRLRTGRAEPPGTRSPPVLTSHRSEPSSMTSTSTGQRWAKAERKASRSSSLRFFVTTTIVAAGAGPDQTATASGMSLRARRRSPPPTKSS